MPLRSFRLAFDTDEVGKAILLEFEAIDPSDVFQILQHETVDRIATLWEGETRLGTVQRSQLGVWQLTR